MIQQRRRAGCPPHNITKPALRTTPYGPLPTPHSPMPCVTANNGII
ncbi:hypothetical protein NSP_12610 [Nodularia spumigena CCY9414]|nr:hypothetical protein NSP_12610 [Nodularia spumigena CCY9414]